MPVQFKEEDIMKKRFFTFLFILVLTGALAVQGAAPKVEFQQSKYKVDVLIGGKLFTSYLHTPDPAQPLLAPKILLTKPVLYPVHSPSGIIVTRGFPFTDVQGEKRDHPHHIGLYFTVDNVGPDKDAFWGNSSSPLPAIHHVRVLKMKGGTGTGTLATLSEWVGKSGKALLQEEREMVFRAVAPDQIDVDFTIWLKALNQEIDITDTKEGMFAIRVAQWLTEEGTGRYLNSEGQEMEKGVWGKRANWVRLQGEKDGKPIGIAIFNHPTSTNSPTYWHARGYGCFSVNPLGQLDFQKAHRVPDPKPFDLKIKAGDRALFKYRMIIYEGNMDKARADALYQSYAR
jgi:hypothetical protein